MFGFGHLLWEWFPRSQSCVGRHPAWSTPKYPKNENLLRYSWDYPYNFLLFEETLTQWNNMIEKRCTSKRGILASVCLSATCFVAAGSEQNTSTHLCLGSLHNPLSCSFPSNSASTARWWKCFLATLTNSGLEYQQWLCMCWQLDGVSGTHPPLLPQLEDRLRWSHR